MCGVIRFFYKSAFFFAEAFCSFVSLGSTYVVLQMALGTELATVVMGGMLTYVTTEAVFFPEDYYGDRRSPFAKGSIAHSIYAFVLLYSAAVPLATFVLLWSTLYRFDMAAAINSTIVFFFGAQTYGHLVWRIRRWTTYGDEAMRRRRTREKKKKANESGLGAVARISAKEEELKKALIVVEGSMAVGKTTLCNKMKSALEELGDVRFHAEEVYDEKHEQFMKDPKSNAYDFQLHMRDKRVETFCQMIERSDGTPELIDRSLLGDLAFALWNTVCGNIEITDFETYFDNSAFRRALSDLVAQRVTVLFVYASADACAARIARRDTNDKDTDVEYLRGITIMHYIVMCWLLERRPHVPLALVDGHDRWDHSNSDLFRQLAKKSFVHAKSHALKPYVGTQHGTLQLDAEQIGVFRQLMDLLKLRETYTRMYGGRTAALNEMEISEAQWFDELRRRVLSE